MANYNTGVTGTLTAQPHGTAFTMTIPAGVLTGDVMIVSIEVFTQNGSSNSFGTPTSGGGSWTQIASTLTATYTGGGTFPCYGMAWYRVATAADASSTFSMSYTGTTPSPDQLWWAGDLEAYTGFYTASPIGNTATFTNGNSTTITAPSTTTTAASSWEVDTCPVSIQASGTISTEPLTNRHTVSTQGISNGVSDSNGSVGASGTTIGGGNWTTSAAVNNSGMAFTIELRTAAPGGAVSGTVEPRATVPVPRRKLSRALWRGGAGQAYVAVPAPLQEFQLAPRRRLARALWHGGSGQAFVAVPAPLQEFRLAPRRKLNRAVVQFTPVATTNASVSFVAVPAPLQQPRPAPRRRLARAYVRFTPVATTNAPAVPGSVPVLMFNQTRIVVRRDGRVVRR